MGIEIHGIRKTFGENEVLKGIDFKFDAGQVNMIIGASGSGKTVLLKCLVGLMEPDEGLVMYGGENLLDMNYQQLRNLRKKIGMLFQGSALFDSLTIGENVAFPLKMFSNLHIGEIKERVAYYLEKVNLDPNRVAPLYPSEISGGMKKRVGIARAIVLQPSYLFCDEPNSGLDPQTAEVIDELLRKITDELKTTTIIVSHDMKSVLTIGDKIMFIYRGAKEWEGSRDDVATAENTILKKFIEISGVVKSFDTHL